jgi:hypothetical protein
MNFIVKKTVLLVNIGQDINFINQADIFKAVQMQI